jgi:hypothetical protein
MIERNVLGLEAAVEVITPESPKFEACNAQRCAVG